MTETRASSETKPPARRGPSQPNADGLMGPGRQPLARALGLAFAVPLILLSLGITAINAWNARRTAEALADEIGRAHV